MGRWSKMDSKPLRQNRCDNSKTDGSYVNRVEWGDNRKIRF
jgi:hypothetical protein